ncbi:unnamed protein product [Ectocarpus sp. 4 AP-2014]
MIMLACSLAVTRTLVLLSPPRCLCFRVTTQAWRHRYHLRCGEGQPHRLGLRVWTGFAGRGQQKGGVHDQVFRQTPLSVLLVCSK